MPFIGEPVVAKVERESGRLAGGQGLRRGDDFVQGLLGEQRGVG